MNAYLFLFECVYIYIYIYIHICKEKDAIGYIGSESLNFEGLVHVLWLGRPAQFARRMATGRMAPVTVRSTPHGVLEATSMLRVFESSIQYIVYPEYIDVLYVIINRSSRGRASCRRGKPGESTKM